ncbi:MULTISPECIES: bifunctional protein-disulfide isomerase/oxidoreductase DsbC [Pasteurellaceae]|uniref:Thiol:disulfide interchange protein n=1 Tax=Pasteurella atlantica TaxID=2827233 RepID=A0AAW8CHA5_9PAST|nr:bifunctional protein-disulfide isomerase/oxidoreductase DsbC [Pasteurella atlantica]MBR0574476.1 bifunctional protein-disulfide isomerase/oxidoreductase DsbC [Pasteurella atlantica]MDP8039354.1 bifunctional protein-disulfide isomerase/oxidoreductase DsbC [Pasteurella atlantica]MDP8041446.1 bifunctional protein-disulfide isomerase/oxidoreductase DsbC [Pasteurella atlantica]MDP8043629.1 bifunctional protein-disulfide isomerase/oxidoreductase DsbC [Pasteurella atlantica]MDP8045667.1 bifunction
MNKLNLTFALGLVALPFYTVAENEPIKNSLNQIGIGISDIDIQKSELSGFKSIITQQGVIQVSDDGQYLIPGRVLKLKNGTVSDITNTPLLYKLNTLENEMIVFSAKNEKFVITVFMDISCHYCHKLFSQTQEYNDLGITVRYFAFPRAGLDSQIAAQMEAIWQSKDKKQALIQAENGILPTEFKKPNLIVKQYELGIQYGISGTPSIVTDKGELINGYVEPQRLLDRISHKE